MREALGRRGRASAPVEAVRAEKPAERRAFEMLNRVRSSGSTIRIVFTVDTSKRFSFNKYYAGLLRVNGLCGHGVYETPEKVTILSRAFQKEGKLVYRRAYLFKNRSIRPMITWPQMAVAVSVAIAINAVMGETSGGFIYSDDWTGMEAQRFRCSENVHRYAKGL